MKTLENIISRFNKTKILVIGDLILDQYIWGSVDRVSPEAPVPVVWANKRTYLPGGAANVANNISSLGGKATLVGVMGRDNHAKILTQELHKRNIDTRGVFTAQNRHTILKSRVIAGHQQIVRVDWENRESLGAGLNKRIIGFIKRSILAYDALIIEDYGKGVINKDLLEDLISLAHENKKIITVDPKEDHFQFYRKATTITPNRKELENAIRNLKIKDEENRFKLNSDRLFTDRDIDLAAFEIMEYLELESILVTLGEQGMKLFEKDGRATHIPTQAQAVFDVSGAGDTVISAFTLGLSAGAKKLEAAYIANYAAGIVVGKVGTAVTTREELLKRIK
ncbi:MAG: D-glycero-beta-D-manno-heptose-7-phosphate kinase [Candidatus Omnitrophota bacterium]|jgi:D-beta-D-heptose 7-phosphate kinase/D-beta-D-heptose 1-phosphate adenosyltransferase